MKRSSAGAIPLENYTGVYNFSLAHFIQRLRLLIKMLRSLTSPRSFVAGMLRTADGEILFVFVHRYAIMEPLKN